MVWKKERRWDESNCVRISELVILHDSLKMTENTRIIVQSDWEQSLKYV